MDRTDLEIAAHQTADLDFLIASRDTCYYTLRPTFIPEPTKELLWDPGIEVIRHTHKYIPSPHEIRVYAASNCDVLFGGSAVKDGRYLRSDDTVPRYVSDTGLIYSYSPTQIVPINHPVFCIFHPHLKIYGHFFLEMFPKAFVLNELHRLGLQYPILVPDHVPDYYVEMMKALAPSIETITVPRDSVVKAPRVLIPSMCNAFSTYHPAYLDFLSKFANECAASLPNLPRRIYVTRGKIDSFWPRKIVNESEIIRKLVDFGFEVILPHELTLEQKFAVFHHAKVVVGEYGSGLHNTLISPAGTNVVGMNWCNDVQQGISRSRGHSTGFMLADDGELRMPFPSYIGALEMTFDPDKLIQHLQPIINQQSP